VNIIKDVVFSVLEEIGSEYNNDELKLPTEDTRLFGRNLDSFGVILMVTEVEEKLSNVLGFNISLADDRAMSQKTSPFRNVKTLLDYVEMIINEKKL
jgi:acyl carrier protein